MKRVFPGKFSAARFWACLAAAAVMQGAGPAAAQDYPSKPMRVIASSAAGGISDIFMQIGRAHV
mgnify:CR=1 FL=1